MASETSPPAHSYMLLKHKGDFRPRGMLVELASEGRYKNHSHCSSMVPVTTSADSDEVAPLTEEECRILDAMDSNDDRYKVYNSGKLAWGVGLKVGNSIMAKLPPKDEHCSSEGDDRCAKAILRWYGNVDPIGDEKYLFGVEITDEKYLGQGESDGKFGEGMLADQFFSCQPKCGLFLSLEKMEQLPPSNGATVGSVHEHVSYPERHSKGKMSEGERFSSSEGKRLKREVDRLHGELKEKETVIAKLQRDITRLQGEAREKSRKARDKQREIGKLQGDLREKQRLQARLESDGREKEATISKLRDQLARQANELRQVKQEAEQNLRQAKQEVELSQRQFREEKARHQQLTTRIEAAMANLRGDATLPQQALQLWEISREDVEVSQTILGTGGWGYVAKGTFRGQEVAVKCLHHGILSHRNEGRVKREISIMAQVRHPNLLLLIGAVVSVEGGKGPLIVMELLERSLRSAYEQGLLEEQSKLPILRDVASALTYLHSHRTPILHRDVSSANVLLEAVRSHKKWKAKVSDFGSANLCHLATTPAEGNAIYSAPEVSTEDRSRQTAKIDVYSFGVLTCEVCLCQFPPERKELDSMLRGLERKAPDMLPLVRECISHAHKDRPHMKDVLHRIDQLYKTRTT